MEKRLIPYRLLVIVFLTGAVLMALEIVGSRILAPRFGNTIYVWGSLISIFIGSLALGYYIGGKLSDVWPHKLPLGVLICLAGVYLMALPLFSPAVCGWLDLKMEMSSRLAVLLAAFLLFALPSILLGCVSPYAIRLAARDIEKIGMVAGILYAVSTFGSLLGSLMTAFVLIPVLGVILIVRLLGIALFFTTALLLVTRKWWKDTGVFIFFILTLIGLLLLIPEPGLDIGLKKSESLIYNKDSAYQRVAVIDHPIRDTYLSGPGEKGGIRYMRFDIGFQSAIFLDPAEYGALIGTVPGVETPPYPTALPYTEYFWLPFLWRPDAVNAAFIGGGACVMPRMFVEQRPDIYVDVVEIDPLVIDAAKKYFFLDPERYKDEEGRPRLDIFEMDGRRFFSTEFARNDYDIIILDTYSMAGMIPFHLTTREYFMTVKSHLAKDGVALLNLYSRAVGPGGKIFRHIYKTMASVFDQVYVFPVFGRRGAEYYKGADHLNQTRNFILIAADFGERITPAELMKRALEYQVPLKIPVTNFVRQTLDLISPAKLEEIVPASVKVITDDWAPTDTWPH